MSAEGINPKEIKTKQYNTSMWMQQISIKSYGFYQSLNRFTLTSVVDFNTQVNGIGQALSDNVNPRYPLVYL